MPRPKGLPKTGGRQAGTPNKDHPLKQLLHQHSLGYFTPSITRDEAIAQYSDLLDTLSRYPADYLFSQYDLDCLLMKASDRARLEVDLLAYHTPKMQAISADLAVRATNITLSDRIRRLAAGDDIPSGNED